MQGAVLCAAPKYYIVKQGRTARRTLLKFDFEMMCRVNVSVIHHTLALGLFEQCFVMQVNASIQFEVFVCHGDLGFVESIYCFPRCKHIVPLLQQ